MHISNKKDKFTKINDHQIMVYTSTEKSVSSNGKGQIDIKVNVPNKQENNVGLQDAVLVPKFKNNLLSVSQITKKTDIK